MAKLRVLSFLLCTLLTTALSQLKAQNFTESITSEVAGQGTITITQDSLLEAIVNGDMAVETTPANTKKDDFDIKQGKKQKLRGYRIQIYWGGSSRNDQMQAERLRARAASIFPQFKGYVGYESPHWHCRIGDFSTRAEAAEYLQRMRSLNKEAMIVPSEIVVYKEF